MLIAFPFLFPPQPVNETVADLTTGYTLVSETQLREGVAGQDSSHWGRGGVHLYSNSEGAVFVEFQADFETGPGPDYWIYLNASDNIDDEADFQADTKRIRIAKLKSFSGSQIYKLTAQQFANAKAITIWCEAFGQYIASANIAI